MINAILFGLRLFILVLSGQKHVALANAAMRQQLRVFKRDVKRPKLNRWYRLFWIGLKTILKDWRSALVIVRPETVSGGSAHDSSAIGRGCLSEKGQGD